jgi:hypothetical protein
LISIIKFTLIASVVAISADGIQTKLKTGSAVYSGYTIETGSRSFARAVMIDGTNFTLGKDASASLDEFEYNVAAKIGKFAATVKRGGFEYESGKIGLINKRRNHSTISTSTAIVSIRGSKTKGEVDAKTGKTTVIHLAGVLSVTDCRC